MFMLLDSTVHLVCFFKQKTAYEMRISDWSSDVCSSDLATALAGTALAQDGDAAAGEKVFNKCKACHTVDAGKNKVGPSLHDIIGRAPASVEGFKYSKAMEEFANGQIGRAHV